MKEKSFSKKQLTETENIFVNFGTKYLLNWTKKELNKYKEEPVVIPIGEYGFLVGKYKVFGLAKNCWKVETLDGNYVNSFVTKKNALLYCLLEVSKKHSLANEILFLDIKLGNLENDILSYNNILIKSKDKLKTNAILHRLIDAKSRYRSYSIFLKKTLNSAKYLNFGNKHYEIN